MDIFISTFVGALIIVIGLVYVNQQRPTIGIRTTELLDLAASKKVGQTQLLKLAAVSGNLKRPVTSFADSTNLSGLVVCYLRQMKQKLNAGNIKHLNATDSEHFRFLCRALIKNEELQSTPFWTRGKQQHLLFQQAKSLFVKQPTRPAAPRMVVVLLQLLIFVLTLCLYMGITHYYYHRNTVNGRFANVVVLTCGIILVPLAMTLIKTGWRNSFCHALLLAIMLALTILISLAPVIIAHLTTLHLTEYHVMLMVGNWLSIILSYYTCRTLIFNA